MKWVLIYIVSTYGVGITTGNAEFETRDACVLAVKDMRKAMPPVIGALPSIYLARCYSKGAAPK